MDEVEKAHFSIPINLRGLNLIAVFDTCISLIATNSACVLCPGYPPADHVVRDFLTQNGSETESYIRACCFIQALFEQTLQVVENPDFGDFHKVSEAVERFRILMTTGQTMKGHGLFRTEFYNKVIQKAKQYASLWKVCIFELGCYFWLTVTQDGSEKG